MENKIAFIDELEDLKKPELPEFIYEDENGKTKVDQLKVVDAVIKDTKYFSTSDSLPGFAYNGQYWEQFKTQAVRDLALKSKISELLGKYSTARVVKDILYLLIAKSAREDLKGVFNNKPSLVSFKNTAVDGDTMQFIPNSPDLYILGGFDFKITEDTKCGKTLNLFTETLGENAPFMIEFFGSMFHRNYRPFQYMVIVQGGAGTGKSYLVELMRKFLGSKMTTSLSLEQIAKDKFMTANLYGSYANIKSDLNNDFIPSFETINNLVGSDELQVQFKGENSFGFTNHAKLLFTANEAPTIKTNDGIKRRMKILNVKSQKHVITGNDDNEYEGYMPERGAFVYYAMSMFMKAKNAGEMSITDDIEQATSDWFMQGDDIQQWAKDHLVADENSRPRSNWIYKELGYDWNADGLKNVPSAKTVMKRLRELGYEIKLSRSSTKNTRDEQDTGQVASRIIGINHI